MLKLLVEGAKLTVTEEVYRSDFFGKVNHINLGFVPAENEVLPVYEPAPASIFADPAPPVETPPETHSYEEVP